MPFRPNRDVNQTYCLVLYSYLTFTDRVGVGVGWLEKWGIKLSHLSTEVEVEVEDELGNVIQEDINLTLWKNIKESNGEK